MTGTPAPSRAFDPQAFELHFLDFDFQWLDEPPGGASCDAIALVAAARAPELIAEVEAVLAWAADSFPGSYAPLEEGGTWTCDVAWQVMNRSDANVRAGSAHIDLPARSEAVRLSGLPALGSADEIELTFTLAGDAHFAAALQERFGL